MSGDLDIAALRAWIGREESASERLSPGPARRFQATLDHMPELEEGAELPPFWHYLYFNPEVPARALQQDGHEQLGRFMPPVPLPRRMWAGGSLEVLRPLRLGDVAQKRSTIQDISIKDGRSGPLCFVSVAHTISVDGAPRVIEHQNIVYRKMPTADTQEPLPRKAPANADFSQTIRPDAVMLFRYSALIFYGHRIHYDLDYTRSVEGYPGLVVHGPLTATLLMNLARAQKLPSPIARFDIRAHAPLFSPHDVFLEGRRVRGGLELWARREDGTLAMTVSAHSKEGTSA